MLPVRWKIFRLANYLQLIATLLLLAVSSYGFLSFDDGSGDGLGYFLLFILVFVIVIVNNVLNVQILHRHFPDKSLSAGKKTAFIVLLVLYILVFILAVITLIVAISEMSDHDYHGYYTADLVGAGILAFYVIVGAYVSVLQIMLPGVLSRNNNQHIEQLLENIGKPD